MPVFKPVDKTYSFSEHEKKVLQFWREHRIFEKSLERPAPKGPFVFYEGPPTANGKPHAGHVLTRVMKDLFPRYRTMCGYEVARKGGWDTHGLPVEIEVEKELGISGKEAIESYGVEAYVKKCMESVFRYTREWEDLTDRIGFWLDTEGAYVTYHISYVESVWWSLKTLFDRGLLFRGHKVVPWCPRCGTGLSSHEVGQGYEEVDDPSAYVMFRIPDQADTYFLAWTTTPWTLLSNAALAVGEEVSYAWVKWRDRTLILAADLVEKVMGKEEHEVLRQAPGSELLGTAYEPLFDFATFSEKAHFVVAADFVTLDAGTGIVHIAPAFGADDYRVGLEHGLPVIQLVDEKGEFTPEVEPWAGRFCKGADKEISRHLRERGLLFKVETYRHDYPHCWRCHGPLIYFARDSWFVRTTQEVQTLLDNNNAIHWQPDHIRTGRFGKFLESNVDWALSRERYWGTPLPIWCCPDCGREEAFGSRAEILARNPEAFSGFGARREADPDLSPHLEVHKPFIDDVTVPCSGCSSPMRRVSEVIDCWYDAGSMPFAQWGYPHLAGSKEQFEGAFPADFISEAIDQTRGWFYTLLAVSTLVFPEAELPHPYRRCIVLGHVSDKKGKKYSKHLKNYVPPEELIERQGADALRWFFLSAGNPWTNIKFAEDLVAEANRDFLLRLSNVYNFFVIYANIDEWNPGVAGLRADLAAPAELPELDRWVLSELQRAVASVRAGLDAYDVQAASTALFSFVDGLSNWYLRRSRARFWTSEAPAESSDKRAAYTTLHHCLVTLSRLMAPFTPFFGEELHQNLVRTVDDAAAESVHLTAYPEVDEALRDEDLAERMALAREVVALGRGARTDAQIKVRQPLHEAVVILTEPSRREWLADLWDVVKDELNVKRIRFEPAADEYVHVVVKLNFPRLGPRLGGRVKKLQAAVRGLDAAALKDSLDASGEAFVDVEGESIRLEPDDVKVEISSREGFAARSSRDVVVALETGLDDDLIAEGRVRELSSLVNKWRAELELRYEQRIELVLQLGSEVQAAAERHLEGLKRDCLASLVSFASADGIDRCFEAEIDGEKVRGVIRPVGRQQ